MRAWQLHLEVCSLHNKHFIPVCLPSGQIYGCLVTMTTQPSNDLCLISGETDTIIVINSAVSFVAPRAEALQIYFSVEFRILMVGDINAEKDNTGVYCICV